MVGCNQNHRVLHPVSLLKFANQDACKGIHLGHCAEVSVRFMSEGVAGMVGDVHGHEHHFRTIGKVCGNGFSHYVHLLVQVWIFAKNAA